MLFIVKQIDWFVYPFAIFLSLRIEKSSGRTQHSDHPARHSLGDGWE